MRILIVCALVVSLSLPVPLFAASKSPTSAPPTACSPGTAAVAAEIERVEVLRGGDARAFVATLNQQNAVFRQAQKRSAEQLNARGFKPTESVVVVKAKMKDITRPVGILTAIRNWFLPSVHAQTYNADDGSGYMVVQSWDDGNNSTWEGNLFTQEYGGAYTSLDNQIYVDTNYSLLWASGSGDPGDGSGGRLIRGQICNGGCRCIAGNAGDCMLRNTLSDSWNWCSANAGACAFLGKDWFACMGLTCVTRIAALMIGQMRLWRQNCQNGC